MEERPDAPQRSGLRAKIRAISIDTRPLKISPNFRRIWSASIVSYLGSHITAVAIPFQIYEITGSPAAVGLIGLVELLPLLVLSLVGGAVASVVVSWLVLAVLLGRVRGLFLNVRPQRSRKIHSVARAARTPRCEASLSSISLMVMSGFASTSPRM